MGLSTLLALGAHEGAMAPPPARAVAAAAEPRGSRRPGGQRRPVRPCLPGGGGGAAYGGAGVGCCSGLDPTQFSSEAEARAVSNARPPYAASTQREVDEALSRYQAALTRTAKAASGSSLTAAQRPSMTDSSQGYPASLSRAGRGDADLNAPAHRRT